MSETCWCNPAPGEYHPWQPMELALCDPDGIVRRGSMHHGDDYECTGHAHTSGMHVRCTSPAHDDVNEDGVDWAEVAWADLEQRGEVACCDWRHHSGDDACECPNHPQSYLHPSGTHPWPAP